MSNVIVAKVDKFQRFNHVTDWHFVETDYTDLSGFVFLRDREGNPVVAFMHKNGCEGLYKFDDLAYITLDDSETDDTQSVAEKPERYTVDEIASEIRDSLELGRCSFSDITDGTIYSYLSGYFPDASMAQCHVAVMKVWKDRISPVHKEDK